MKGTHITLKTGLGDITYAAEVDVEQVTLETGIDWSPLDAQIEKDEAMFNSLSDEDLIAGNLEADDIEFWHWVYHHDFS